MLIKIPKWVSKLTGDIYFHKYPFFLVYKPRLHQIKGHQIRKVIDLVQPGDIFLRSFNGYLNTVLIGGWGHAALYVGDNTVIHSVSKGVVKEDILDFCRADEIVILRVQCPQTEKKSAIEKIKNLLGTKYDYNFISNNNLYYCSELIDVVYNGLFNHDYKKVLNRMVIVPDDIFNSKETEIIFNSKDTIYNYIL